MDSSQDTTSSFTVQQASVQDDRTNFSVYLPAFPLINNAIDETIAENNACSKEILQLLNQLNIDPKSMAKNIQDLWLNVSTILRTEGLYEMDEVALTITMEQKRKKSVMAAREERKLITRYSDICDRRTSILKKCNEARESIESLQKIIDSSFVNDTDDYANRILRATKLNDYRQAVNQLDSTLNEMDVSDSYPEKILEKHKVYLSLMEELHKVDESLKKYGELPPNILEARIIVEEQEKHLMELNNELLLKMH